MNIQLPYTLNGEFTEVTVRHIYPHPYCAYYSHDSKDEPRCGWGATPEEAIVDLFANYAPEDVE